MGPDSCLPSRIRGQVRKACTYDANFDRKQKAVVNILLGDESAVAVKAERSGTWQFLCQRCSCTAGSWLSRSGPQTASKTLPLSLTKQAMLAKDARTPLRGRGG